MHLGLFEDETAKACHWHLPAAHYLEAWGDVYAYDGTYSAVQPMILPLWNGIGELEILAQLAGRPKPQGPELVQETFTRIFNEGAEKWNSVLRVGFAPESEWPEAPLSFNAAKASEELKQAKPPADGLELVFLQSTSVDDGRYANNSWLQETPDFETKVTWDNVALVSPATAKKLGIKANNFGPIYKVAEKLGNEIDFDIVADMIEIKSAAASIVAAAFVAPGHADDSISLALGYGRAGVSALFEGVGFNAYPLRSSDASRFLSGVEVKVPGKTYPLAQTQEHRSMEGRDLFREGTLERYQEDPKFAQTMGMDGHIPPNISLYTHPELTARRAMGHDGGSEQLHRLQRLRRCLPGGEQHPDRRQGAGSQEPRDALDPHRPLFRAAIPEDPEMLAQAVMCQHCENAPCETVCPVNATVHSEDGLNVMAYNRCIGTRYCANNCPYKVRRFNYFDYNKRRSARTALVSGAVGAQEGHGRQPARCRRTRTSPSACAA